MTTTPATQALLPVTPEGPFHVSRSSDGTKKWFSARDPASGVTIPAKDRDDAYALVSSLNRACSTYAASQARSLPGDVGMNLAAAFGPILKEAFPDRTAVERMSVGEALAEAVIARASWFPAPGAEVKPSALGKQVREMALPDDPHTDAWQLGCCRARKMAADLVDEMMPKIAFAYKGAYIESEAHNANLRAALTPSAPEPVQKMHELRSALDGVDCITRRKDEDGGQIVLTWLEPKKSWPLFNLLSAVNSGLPSALSGDAGEAMSKRTFLTCVSGDGPQPYLKVHFNNLADAHAAHDELLGRKGQS